MEEYSCKGCTKRFSSYPSKKQKYCSHECAMIQWRGRPTRNPGGYKLSEEVRAKMKLRSGNKAAAWKGDDVSYRGIHAWIALQKERPKSCSHCKETKYRKDGVLNIHWANISGQYKRDLDDWIALCAKCHKAYDSIQVRV